MRKQTNEMVTINDAMVNAIAQAVTSAIVSALASTSEAGAVASETATAEASTKTAKANKPETTATASKSKKGAKASIDYSKSCFGYIETKAGDIVYIAKLTHDKKHAWVADIDKDGAPVLDDKGRVKTLYDETKYNNAKDKAIKAGKYKRDPKTHKLDKARISIYKSLKWVVSANNVIAF